MTLWRGDRWEPPSAEPVYTGCPAAAVDAIRDHIAAMNDLPAAPDGRLIIPASMEEYREVYDERKWADKALCGVCVPESDPRSVYLPECSEAEALCRGLYFRPSSNISSWECAQKPINYEDVADRNNDFFGCS